MALVPLKELLAKYSISRKTYHNLLNKGLLPHYSKRHGEPGKRGARYLYDAEVFDEAWKRYCERTSRGLGINVDKRDRTFEAIDRMPKGARIDFILETIPAMETESLSEFDARIAARRGELALLSDEEIHQKVLDLFREGNKPRSWAQ